MKILLPLLFCLVPSLICATENPIELSSAIKKVIVFKEGAQVTRMAKVEIPTGKSIYRFAGVTPDLDAKSIQLKGEGDFTILSVHHQLNFFEVTDKSEVLFNLEAEVEQLQQQVEEWNIQIKVLDEEEKLIVNNNKKSGKEDETLPVDELKSMAAFYREQIAEIRLSKLDFKRKINEQLKAIRKTQQQINEIKSANQDVETSEILVTVVADQAVTGQFELSYFVSNAGWSPTYDIRVQDVQSPIQLLYKANVVQSTGEEWKEVKLTLSTATPKQSGTKPNLQRWNLGFYNPTLSRNLRDHDSRLEIIINEDGSKTVKGRIFDQETGEPLIGANVLVPGTSTGTITDFDGIYEIQVPNGTEELYISYTGYEGQKIDLNNRTMLDVGLTSGALLDEVVVLGYGGRAKKPKTQQEKATTKPIAITTYEKITSVEFEIELPYTIPSSGKEYMVNINNFDIPAYYEYYSAPKLDKDVFLTAMITNWEDYHLLTGSSNLYFEGTFIGNAMLDVESLKDTLSISLGRDKNVIVERTLLKDFSKTQFIGNKKIESRAVQIEIRNKKNHPINLVIEDQFPVSVVDDIEVKRESYNGAVLDENSGKLVWELSISAQSQQKVGFGYSVKYPKREWVVLD